MATHLYRLGRWSFTHRRTVLLVWVALIAVAGVSAAAFSGQTSDQFSVPGTESQDAQDLLQQKFPAAAGASARMVFQAPKGQTVTSQANREAVESSLLAASKSADVSQVTDPYEKGTISKDKRIAFADVIYPVPSGEIDHSAREQLKETAEPARAAGLQVEFGGGLVPEQKESSSESTGVILAYIVLAITLASLLAAGMPVLTAIIGVGIGVEGVHALSGVIDVSETAPILATMLGLAVGIDYALFILSRHRQNMADGMDVAESAATAVATAGSAVVFAGATVVIALVGLTVVNIPFLTVMGLAAAGTVSIAVLIALTLLPALFGFAGGRLKRRNRVLARRSQRAASREKASLRWCGFVTRRPLPVLLVGIGLMVFVALPALHVKLGLPDGGSQPTSTTERRSYDLLSKGFGPGANGPLTIVVDAPGQSPEEQKDLAKKLSSGLEDFPGVASVSQPIQNNSGEITVVQVTPTSGPASDQTKDLVAHLRDKADEIQAETGIQGFVTGTTALNIDTADTLNAALPKYIGVVVGLALILLTLVFRSILVPLKACAGFLLSIAASMGLVVWVFQDGHLTSLFGVASTGPIVSFLPVLLIGILFGLAMDYEVFLVSRMREDYVHTGEARESVVRGYGQSGRVVTAAAIIMTGVFGAFILDDDPIVKSIGLALAFGVIADAFLVRLTLVPAVMSLLGRHAWRLPRSLERLLPHMDVEGAGLEPTLTSTR